MIPKEETELEEAIYEINTILEPEDGGSIDIANEIKEGEDLEFTVTVNEGYALPIVSVNGDEIEANEEDLENAEFSYFVSDIYSDTDTIDINVMFMPSNDVLMMLNEKNITNVYEVDIEPNETKRLEGESGFAINDDNWYFSDSEGNEIDNNIDGIRLSHDGIVLDHREDVVIDKNLALINPDLFRDGFYVAHDFKDNSWSGVKTELFHINITNTNAYFYVKKKPNLPDSDSSADYMFWGTGSVPFGDASNYDVKHDYIDDDWKDLIVWPEDPGFSDYEGYDPDDGYPILTDGEYDYHYWNEEGEEPEEAYYTIEWEIYTVANGALGPDGETPLEGSYSDKHEEWVQTGYWPWEGHYETVYDNIPTWHVDANVEFHKEDSVHIIPKIQDFERVNSDNFVEKYYKDLPGGEILPKDTAGDEAITYLENWSDIQAIADDISLAEEAGYEFAWYLDETGTTLATADAIDALVAGGEDVIYVYGLYTDEEPPVTENIYVNYNSNGGVGTIEPAELRADYTGAYSLLSIDEANNAFTRENATVIGWSENPVLDIVDSDDEYAGIKDSVINSININAESVIVYAVWAEDLNGDDTPDYQQLHIVFDLVNDQDAKFNELDGAYISTDGTRAYYFYDSSAEKFDAPLPIEDVDFTCVRVFDGWSKYANQYSYEQFITMFTPASWLEVMGEEGYTITFTAKFSDPTVNNTLTFNANDLGKAVTGSVPAEKTYAAGTEVDLTSIGNEGNLDIPYAVFAGWSTIQVPKTLDTEQQIRDAIDRYSKVIMDSNKTVYAVWATDSDNDGIPEYLESKEITVEFEIGDVSGVTFDDDTEAKGYTIDVGTGNAYKVYDKEKDEAFDSAPTLNINDPYLEFAGWYYGGESLNPDIETKVVSYDDMLKIKPADWDNMSNVKFRAKFNKLADYTVRYIYDGVEGSMPDTEFPAGGKAAIGSTVTVELPDNSKDIIYEGVRYTLYPADQTFTINAISDDPEQNIIEVKYAKDDNADHIPDSQQRLLVFDLGTEYGAEYSLMPTGNQTLVNDTILIYSYGSESDIVYAAAPDMEDIYIDPAYGVVISDWVNIADGTSYDPETVDVAVGSKAVYKAVYDKDENDDGIPDGQQTKVYMRPFATTIYSGGNSGYDHYDGTGFPELELEVKLGEAFTGEEDRGDRGARNDLVTEVNINGTWLSCDDSTEGINEYLEAIYVYPTESGDYEIISDDSEYRDGGYRAVVAVKETALSAFNSADYYSDPDTHLIRNRANGDKYVTISDQSAEGLASIGIRAYESEESNNIINYFVTFTTSSLKIRETVGDEAEIYKDVEVRESDVNVAEDQEATAYVPADDNGDQVYYTNGDEFRVVDDDLGITLLEDNVRTDDNRIDLIEDKGYKAAYQMSAEEAEAAGYKSILKYYDLIDNLNGNAWVQSATGTYVYIPYPEGTDQDTEFELMHFKGLHRDTNYEGEEVAAAIEASVLEDGTELQLENTPQGIKFFTSGDDAFSPFMLMWKTDNTGDNGNTGNTGTGSAGGRNESDRNSIGGTYYTVGVNGNWRHMDNVDVNAPLDEAVPAGATAMAAPEWHRWKFFRNDGSNIRSQWAHIANPYAVDDQPKTGWFYFDAEGLMQYGWFLDTATGKWYYLHAESDGMLGTMMTGWHYDLNDGRWYYLDTVTGEMLLGWQNIGGKWYYFNTAPNEQTWNLDSVAGLWRFNNSTARPLGSMYINETTPDGYQVDGSGAWIQ